MRILHVTHSLDPLKGGTSVAVRTIAEGCAAQGVDSPVVVLDHPNSPWLSAWRVPVFAAGPSHTHFGWTPRLLDVLSREVTLADVVVVHGLWQYHNVGVRWVCKRLNKPYVVCPHGMLAPWAVGQSRLTKKLAWRFVTLPLCKDAAALCFTTEHERMEALQTLGSKLNVPTLVQPLGVEAPLNDFSALRAAFATREPNLNSQKIALFLGRLHPKKGCDILIEGFAKWYFGLESEDRPLWHLRLAGPSCSDEYLAYLRALAQRHGLLEGAQITFPGMIIGQQRWEEMAGADVFILPSHQENFAIVVGEALACAKAVLLSDRVNTWPWVVDAGAGLVAADTAIGVEQLLTRWASLNPSQQAECGRRARILFDQQFAMPGRCSAFIQALRELVSKSSRMLQNSGIENLHQPCS